MFKFTLTLATSAFLFMLGTADLFAMMKEDDNSNKSSNAITIPHVPNDVMIQKASKVINPRQLVLVCKDWYRMIRENQNPEWRKLNELHYSTMNPFMKNCMHTYWDNLFYNGVLKYTPTDGGKIVSLKFSELNKDATFDLSACRSAAQYLVITTNIDRFFKVGEENSDKVVILITPRHLVQQRITTSPTHPVAALMAEGDPDKAPINIFWRWGNDVNLALVDYLTTSTVGDISSESLYDNWIRSAQRSVYGEWMRVVGTMPKWGHLHSIDFCMSIF